MCSYRKRSTDQLGEDLAVLSAQLASAMCRWLVLLAEFDRRSGWSDSGARSCAQWVSWRCAVSPGTAREYVRVARALEHLPRTTALFARGELSYSKVRAITRLEDVAREDELLAVVKETTATQLERIVRGYRSVTRLERDAAHGHATRFLRLRQEEDGSVRVSGRLTAEEGAVLVAALDGAREELWAQQREDPVAAAVRRHGGAGPPDDTAPVEDPPDAAGEDHDPEEVRHVGYADALVLLADTALASPEISGRSAPERHQVVVHVDAGALTAREPTPSGHLADGEALAPSVVRRLCCDATLVTALDHAGRTLDVGRRSRAIPPALRRALHARDGGCRFPGCGATRRLDAHHVEHWADGGDTCAANLVSLCRHHHRALHEGGFSMAMVSDGEPEFRRPDGIRIEPHPRAPCVEGRTRLRRRGVSARTLGRLQPALRQGPRRRGAPADGAAGVGQSTSRRSTAHRDSSWRLESWSFRSTALTCASTVLAEMCSRAAISL